MTAVQLSLEVAPHNNRQLFSDHYLNEILPERTEWKNLQIPALRAMQEIREILDRFTPSSIEAQTEDGVVKPVLLALGHTYEVQPALKTPGGTKRPDYVLYGSHTALAANKDKVLTEDLLRTSAFAVGDAKYWNRPLDVALKSQAGDPFSNQNPSFQISFYMQHTGLPWGILTNGRQWRLYNHDTAHKLDRFYEVDLEALVLSGDERKFLYFYAFFRRAAFEPGPLGVQEILQQSIDYALKIGDQLKRQVFDSLRHIAQGFLDFPQNGLTLDSSTLKTIYDNSLILLYRLLFVSYAEARELLPVRESKDYRDSYSLRSITHEIADASTRGRRLLPTSGTRWPRLRELFSAIDKGSPPLNVATFNGGLFDPERHPFLEQYAVGDRHLEQAIDILARVDGDFVDYRDLAEQHLGTIYEGLLEYHLQAISPEDGWTIDLVNDRGERKKIGSYYTPNYIVKYIVDHAVGPALRAAIQGKRDDQKIEAILGVNVLDPAMGSAYFLVEATEYIARFIVNLALPKPDGETAEESDLAYWKRRVVQSCIYGVDINPLAVELAKLSLWLSTVAKDRPLSFLDHHLRIGNSLVGTRVTEAGTSKRQLDVAKKKAKKAETVGQLSMMEDDTFRRSVSTAVDSMWMVEHSKSATVEDVKTQERMYLELRETLMRKYRSYMDLVTATDFGLKIDVTLWPILGDFALGRSLTIPPSLRQWLSDAEASAEHERFFHWDLEFPEVFFDRHGRPKGDTGGFDVIVGNPPYVRQELLSSQKPYLATQYFEVYRGAADLFVYFFDQAMRLLRQSGKLCYITSNSWLRANYAEGLRTFLRTKTVVDSVIDLGDNRVFSSAPDVYPVIIAVSRGLPHIEHNAQVAVFTRGEGVREFESQVAQKLSAVSIDQQSDRGWQLGSNAVRSLVSKMSSAGTTLGELVDGQIYYGVKTGDNDVFVISKTTRDQLVSADAASAEILKPMLQGEDLRPWYSNRQERWLIFTRRGINIERYPAVKHYLDQFREQLEPRPQNWDVGQRWKGRKPGSYKWYEIQDSVDYFAAFEKPKIVYPDITKFPRFSWEEEGSYLGNTAYAITTPESWLLGYLGSRCAWFLISQTSFALGERAGLNRYRLIDQYMRPLPVPIPIASAKLSISGLARDITIQARARHELSCQVRLRILTDLGSPKTQLNRKLIAWWTLDFTEFRAEVRRVLKREIPVGERNDWENWLREQREEREQMTADLVRIERELNQQMYGVFNLSSEEIALIEETTKYKYGEV